MFSRRRYIFSLIAICLLAGLALFLGSRILSPSPRSSPDTVASRLNEIPVPSVARESERFGVVSRRAVEDEWDIRWRQLMAEPKSTARDEDMAAFMEEMAAVDPLRAIALAQSETDPELREELLQGALRGWGGMNPEDAIAWARTQTLMDEGLAMASVFHGAAQDPENALRLTAQLSQQDPERTGDYNSYLVAALGRAGEFSKAAAFAAEAPGEFRLDLLNAVYSRWAESQPQDAMKAIAQLADPDIQHAAFAAGFSRWAKNDAKAAAEYALILPEGNDRTLALSTALRNWAASDPPEAATWINRFDPSPELDMAVANVATQPDALRQPVVALKWAESIVDPKLRVRVTASIVNEWATADPIAARNFAENAGSFRSEERAELLSALEPGFNPVSLLP